MGMRPGRMCAKCHGTPLPGTRYCAKHTAATKARETDAIRRLYDTKAWKVTRAQVLARDPRCCHKDEQGARCWMIATDVHHVIRAELWVLMGRNFFDQDNLEGLCHPHHSAETAEEVGLAGWNRAQQ